MLYLTDSVWFPRFSPARPQVVPCPFLAISQSGGILRRARRFCHAERLKMSDQKKDDELDQVSGGVISNPITPIDPGPKRPPTHPIAPVDPIGGKKSNPVG